MQNQGITLRWFPGFALHNRSAHDTSVILCLIPVPTAPILHPESDFRIHDHISRQFVALWGNKPGNQVFAKNNLINDIFEEEKKLDGRTWFFLENSSVL